MVYMKKKKYERNLGAEKKFLTNTKNIIGSIAKHIIHTF